MALLHILTFPCAVIPQVSVIGAAKTVGWLYLLWSLGFVGLLSLAVLLASERWRSFAPSAAREGRAAAVGVCAAVGLTAAALIYADAWLPPLTVGDRFAPTSVAINYLRGGIAAAALALLWATDRRQRLVVLWLSLTLVAAAAGPILTDLGGRRYTFGWYAGRMSFLVSSYVLLAVLMAEFVKLQHALGAAVLRLGTRTAELTAEVGRRELAERKLVQAQRMEAIGQLAAGVAHDFNNLLSAVVNNLEVILRTTQESGSRRVADRAKAAAFRGARLTRSLLAFGRRQPLQFQTLDTEAVIGESLMLLQGAAGATVTVTAHLPGTTWPCRADPAQLDVALLNLVVNARDAMAPAGGTITITTRNVEQTELPATPPFDDLAPGDYVEIAVADTGSGIAPEHRDKVFEPFFSTKEASKGAGLGLAQVQGFVRQSGGDVIVDGAPGQGTTLRLYLPRARPSPVATDAAARPPAVSGMAESA
jgi:signal transduction histidine kinase